MKYFEKFICEGPNNNYILYLFFTILTFPFILQPFSLNLNNLKLPLFPPKIHFYYIPSSPFLSPSKQSTTVNPLKINILRSHKIGLVTEIKSFRKIGHGKQNERESFLSAMENPSSRASLSPSHSKPRSMSSPHSSNSSNFIAESLPLNLPFCYNCLKSLQMSNLKPVLSAFQEGAVMVST